MRLKIYCGSDISAVGASVSLRGTHLHTCAHAHMPSRIAFGVCSVFTVHYGSGDRIRQEKLCDIGERRGAQRSGGTIEKGTTSSLDINVSYRLGFTRCSSRTPARVSHTRNLFSRFNEDPSGVLRRPSPLGRPFRCARWPPCVKRAIARLAYRFLLHGAHL